MLKRLTKPLLVLQHLQHRATHSKRGQTWDETCWSCLKRLSVITTLFKLCGHSPKLMTSNTLSDLSSAVVHSNIPSALTDISTILPAKKKKRENNCEEWRNLLWGHGLTKVCSEVLDKFNTILLLLPKLEVAILTGCDYEVSSAWQYKFFFGL